MKSIILNYFNQTVLAKNADEAINFIDSLNGISANHSAVTNIEKYFSDENYYITKTLNSGRKYEIATTGCGSTRILCYKPLAETLEKHNEILEERKVKAKEEEDKRFQEKMQEMHNLKKGYYVVELACYEIDFLRGGHKKRYTNWSVLAESKINAYNKSVELAEEKGLFWFASAEKCNIDFIGEWSDLAEEFYNE